MAMSISSRKVGRVLCALYHQCHSEGETNSQCWTTLVIHSHRGVWPKVGHFGYLGNLMCQWFTPEPAELFSIGLVPCPRH